MPSILYNGDVRTQLALVDNASVQCVCTSPPYYKHRDYQHTAQLGQEATLDEYVASLVAIMHSVRSKLRPDGTVWLNLGDGYGSGKAKSAIKAKDLMGVPWQVAFALRADGWWLRSAVIWQKPDSLPDSVIDRPTLDYEYVFLLSKSKQYYYDRYAIQETALMKPQSRNTNGRGSKDVGFPGHGKPIGMTAPLTRNRRSVWTLATAAYPGTHYGVMPETLAELCILASTSSAGCCSACGKPYKRVIERTAMIIRRTDKRPNRTHASGTMVSPPSNRTLGWTPNCNCKADAVPCLVFDPFAGVGTTLVVAQRLGRNAIGVELNPEYVTMAHDRLAMTPTPLFGL